MSSSIPRGLLMYKQVLACGRELRPSYKKREIRSIKNSGREEIMEQNSGNSQKEGERCETWEGAEEKYCGPSVCSMSEEIGARK